MPPRLRPRFEAPVSLSARQVLTRLEANLSEPACPCRGHTAGSHALLYIRDDLRHTWSPYLDLAVEQGADGSLLRGRFGPHPNIWTFFAALYAICAFIALAGLIVGVSQWSLGFSATGFWALPATAVVAGIVYAVALMGQGLAQKQMHQLRQFLNRTLDLADEPASSVHA
jgi:hypothetical protein